MTLAKSTIGLIRSFFHRSRGIPQPEVMSNMIWKTMYPQYGSSGIAPVSDNNNIVQNSLVINNDLLSRFADFQEMSQYPECFTALNIWADEATQEHVINKRSLWFESDEEQIENILDFTFHKQLRIEECSWQIIRNLCKYGNAFKEVVIQDGYGVVKLIGHRSQVMRRIQDEHGNLFGYIEDPTMTFNLKTEEFIERLYYSSSHLSDKKTSSDHFKVFEPWEIVQWRLQSDDIDDLYGISMLEASRWAWKRLQMMEDALVIGKLTKASQRYVYYVDVGDVPPNEARKILNQVKQDFTKQKMLDSTGKINWKYNPMSTMDDIFIARRKDKRSTEIELLSGLDAQSIADTEYFRNKLVSGLGMPKSYLAYDETIGRANLSQMDVRLARSILRIQKCYKNGVRQIADIDLSAKNIDPSRVNYDICMTIPSGALEIAHIEAQKAKGELAQLYQGLNIPDQYLWSNILGMSDNEIEMMQILKSESPQSPQSTEPSAGLELSPAENPEILPKEPEKPAAGGLEASKYRRIPKSKQIMESQQMEVLDRILASNNDTSRRIHELKHLVTDIRQALPKRR